MPNVRAAAPAVLEKLRSFDTPTICNVVELFDLRPRHAGYMDARIQACFPKLPVMVGYASTATFRAASPPRSGNVCAGLADQVASFAELPGPAVVVFQAYAAHPGDWAGDFDFCIDSEFDFVSEHVRTLVTSAP